MKRPFTVNHLMESFCLIFDVARVTSTMGRALGAKTPLRASLHPKPLGSFLYIIFKISPRKFVERGIEIVGRSLKAKAPLGALCVLNHSVVFLIIF